MTPPVRNSPTISSAPGSWQQGPLGRCLVALALLALGGVAAAQCAVGPDMAEVTLPEFLAVYYQDFRSDPSDDLVEFYGGVCVTAVGGAWTVTSERVTVTGLTGDLALHSTNPTLYFGEWQITAEVLDSTVTELTLNGATVSGPDFSGHAERMVVDLVTSEMHMIGLQLNSLAFAVSGAGATLRGEVLTLEGAGVTTCIGMETPPFELEGLHAELNLSERQLELSGGILRVGRARLPLQERIVISEESLATFTLPVKVQTVAGAASRPGTGLGVRMVGVPLEGGVTIDVGATGVDTEHRTGAVALVRFDHQREDTTRIAAAVGLDAGRPFIDIDLERPLTPWLSLVLGAHSGALPGRDARHEGLAGLNATVPLTAARGSFTAEVFSAMTVVAPATAPTTTTIAGSRLGGAVSLTASTPRTAAGSVALTTHAEVTTYPAQDALQWGVRFTPVWSYEAAPLSARISYDRRLTNSGSPFGADVDKLSALSRITGTVRLAGELERWEPTAAWNAQRPPVLSGFLEFRGAHDQVATDGGTVGWQVANAAGGVSFAVGPWTLDANMTAATAGLLNPAADLDAFTLYRVSATLADWPVIATHDSDLVLPHGDFQVGLESEFGLVADLGMRRLELFMGVPLAFPSFEMRPYLAFDFAPTVLEGLLPMWSAHGLDLTFITCCGSFTVGYLNDRGDWSASFSVDLERRPLKEGP